MAGMADMANEASEECCAVCADPLEWVAYGPCGHRDVCSKCVARMRVVLNDKRCCICKQESEAVVVTRAEGGSSLRGEEFALLAGRVKSGGNLWFEPKVGAYVEDKEQLCMLQALSRISCGVCENLAPGAAPVRGAVTQGFAFSRLEDMRRHLQAVHKLVMCDLCLEGRKVFVSEQKVYTRAQLDRHSAKGNSQADGTQEERGGFSGHPLCGFCKKRFYGDNELYTHMAQEHFKCHLCEQDRPGHFVYYNNYEDLETHFRQSHLLCEDPECLARKFVVFATDADLKWHNANAHGGKMSRSQRQAALQIPVSFQYRRPEGDRGGSSFSRDGRRRGRSGYADGEDGLAAAVAASLASAGSEAAGESGGEFRPSPAHSAASASPSSAGNHAGASAGPEDWESEAGPSRYRQAVHGAGPSTLGESAFPPLPSASKSAGRKGNTQAGGRSIASLLGGGKSNVRLLNSKTSKKSQQGTQRPPTPQQSVAVVGSASGESQLPRNGERLLPAGVHGGLGGHGPPRNAPVRISNAVIALGPSGVEASSSGPANGLSGPANGLSGPGNGFSGPGNGFSGPANGFSGPAKGPSGPANGFSGLSPEEIRARNKVMVEQIRTALRGNDEQFAEFKKVSKDWRNGAMSSKDFCTYIVRLGLSHVVPELAELCPDERKQTELRDAYNLGLGSSSNSSRRIAGVSEGTSSTPDAKAKVAGRGKQVMEVSDTRLSEAAVPGSSSSSRDSLGKGPLEVAPSHLFPPLIENNVGKRSSAGSSFNPIPPMREGLGWGPSEAASSSSREKPDSRPFEGQASSAFPPLTSKDKSGLRDDASCSSANGRLESQVGSSEALSRQSSLKLPAGDPARAEWECSVCTLRNQNDNTHCGACGSRNSEVLEKASDAGSQLKRKKKTSKFNRSRLGNGSAAALFGSYDSSSAEQSVSQEVSTAEGNSTGGSCRGVWNNGGGQKLVSKVQRAAIVESAWSK